MLYLVWILSLRASRQTQLFSDYRALKIEKCYCAIFTLNDHKYSLKPLQNPKINLNLVIPANAGI